MIATPLQSKAVLIASLVVNLFLVGAMVGGAYRWSTIRPTLIATAVHPRGLRAAAAELSDTRRTQLREALQHTRRAHRALILSAQSGRRDVLTSLKAEPFDPAALDAALARSRQADAALRAELEQTISQFVDDLNSNERALLVDAMENRAQSRRDAASHK